MRQRRDLKAEAKTIEHMMTHFPKNKYCLTCMHAKCPRVAHRKGAMSKHDKATKFGDWCTGDHLIFRSDASKGSNNERDCFMCLDKATNWLGAYPVYSKSADETRKAIRKFAGKQKIRFFYSDDAPEIKKACEDENIPHEVAPTGIKEANGLAETFVRIEIEGGRCELLQAGFPPCFWPYAIEHYAFSRCIQIINGDSAYNKRHKKGHFPGHKIPFGAAVRYVPAPKRTKGAEIPKMGPNTRVGVMLGYYLSPGGQWSKEYIVADLEQFVGMNFRVGKRVAIERPTTINWRPDVEPLDFPLKIEYDKAHNTLAGLQANPVAKKKEIEPQGIDRTSLAELSKGDSRPIGAINADMDAVPEEQQVTSVEEDAVALGPELATRSGDEPAQESDDVGGNVTPLSEPLNGSSQTQGKKGNKVRKSAGPSDHVASPPKPAEAPPAAQPPGATGDPGSPLPDGVTRTAGGDTIVHGEPVRK